MADAAQGYRAECRNRSAGCRAGTALCETGRTGKDRSTCNRRNQSIASGSTYTAAGDLREEKRRRSVYQQQAAERVRSMTKAERKLFAQFIPTKRAMRQLVAALDEISLSAYTGNVVITGMPGSGTLKLTKCMIREIQASDGNFSGKVAKVNAELINKKDAKALVEKVANGALVIEKAGKLSNEGCEKLADALNQEHTGIIVFVLMKTGDRPFI
ncbi:MAG: hypothetical protein ACLURV_09985 [Gallintestinimicrobium sp.]